MLEPFIKGLFLGVILSLSVGPVIFAIIKQSINYGHLAGIFFVLGVSLSDISFVLLANIFADLFNKLLTYKKLIALVGSIFLIGYGLFSLFLKKIHLENTNGELTQAQPLKNNFKYFINGFLMNTLNPSVFIFWFAWTATIANLADDSKNALHYKIIVFTTCLVFVLLSDLLKVFLSHKIRSKITHKSLLWLNRIAGIIIIGFGIFLLVST